MKQLNLLLLCNKPAQQVDANTIIDHIEAFERYSKHTIYTLSMMGDFTKIIDIQRFDGVIIHYSICLFAERYLSNNAKQVLRDFKGLKIIFVQDEYRKINRMIKELSYLKVDLLFTCFPQQEVDRIYTPELLPQMAKCSNLTGYIPEWMMQLSHIPIAKRTLHVGYRGRQLPFWYGELSYEKWNIVNLWRKHVDSQQYRYDISYSERDRLYGYAWINFLTNCKATIGVESGASIMDFTGELEKTIDQYQLTYPQASFHEVQQKFLLPFENRYKLNQISPRCFEAIALKTALILYEGEYSGILLPEQHYIPLKKDFSNIQEVLAKLDDDVYLQNLVDRAYEEIALNPDYSYRGFIKQVDEQIDKCCEKLPAYAKLPPYTPESFAKAKKNIPIKTKLYNLGLRIYQKFPYRIRLLIKLILKPNRQVLDK